MRSGTSGIALLLLCIPSAGGATSLRSAEPVDGVSFGRVRAQSATSSSGAVDVAAQGIFDWISAIETGLNDLLKASPAVAEWTTAVLRLYLDHYEPLEAWYGEGAPHGASELAPLIARGELRFHALLAARDPAALREQTQLLMEDLAAIRRVAEGAGVPRVPDPAARATVTAASGAVTGGAAGLRTPEIRALHAAIDSARLAYEAGDEKSALAGVESAYLQGIEPLEARLPGDVVRRLESLVHLDLRPGIARGAARKDMEQHFATLSAELMRADAALASGGSFWFGAFNAFAIIVREGLEAVLLIGALLAYLAGLGAARRERARIWIGAAAGIAATALTWVLARTLIPVTGAGREMMEGVTALVAVVVLLYVSHWLFQKTYIDDWKTYLRERVGRAVTAGSALAMAGLAFAAIYREGFETVLFYQALLLDASGAAVLAGFAPGLALIVLVGALVIRLGVRLPLKQLFGVTNAILLWLALVFLGKGIYNLQEAGVFAPTPLRWLPDHPALHQLLGFHPLLETVLAQLALVAFVGAAYGYYRRLLRLRAAVSLPKAA